MDWRKSVIDELNARRRTARSVEMQFFLDRQNFGDERLSQWWESGASGQLTMAHRVKEFEKRFAAYIGAPFAAMVNSGSSANLLAVSAAANPMRTKGLQAGDEISGAGRLLVD